MAQRKEEWRRNRDSIFSLSDAAMRTIYRIAAAVAVLLLALPQPVLAGGAYGHRTIAAIADANLTPTARARMRALFRAEPLIATSDCPLADIGDASVWADCVRRDSLRWGYTAPWHYQTIDICAPFALDTPCANGNCVTAQIDRNVQLLADRRLPAHVRLESLAWLVHFTGDMHMPLHAGNRDDRGGNDVSAAYGIVEGRMNLHGLWDGALAERAITDGPSLVRRYGSAETADLTAGSIADWSEQSWSIARDIVYPVAQNGPACGPPVASDARARIDQDQIVALIPVVRLQIARAGVRLAALLNQALG